MINLSEDYFYNTLMKINKSAQGVKKEEIIAVPYDRVFIYTRR